MTQPTEDDSHRVEAAGDTDRAAAVWTAEYYLAELREVDALVTPGRPRVVDYPTVYHPAPRPGSWSSEQALDWAQEHLDAILRAATDAFSVARRPRLCCALLDALWPLVVRRRVYDRRLEIDRLLLSAAPRAGEPVVAAAAAQRFGMTLCEIGEYGPAGQYLDTARTLFLDWERHSDGAPARSSMSPEQWAKASHQQVVTEQQRQTAVRQRVLVDEQRALVLLGTGASEEAVAVLRGCYQVFLELGGTDRFLAPVQLSLVEALLATGDAVGARHADALLEQAWPELTADPGHPTTARAQLVRARLAIALHERGLPANLAAADNLLAAAATTFAMLKMPSEAGTALTVQADLARHQGEAALAEVLVRQAREQLDTVEKQKAALRAALPSTSPGPAS